MLILVFGRIDVNKIMLTLIFQKIDVDPNYKLNPNVVIRMNRCCQLTTTSVFLKIDITYFTFFICYFLLHHINFLENRYW